MTPLNSLWVFNGSSLAKKHTFHAVKAFNRKATRKEASVRPRALRYAERFPNLLLRVEDPIFQVHPLIKVKLAATGVGITTAPMAAENRSFELVTKAPFDCAEDINSS
jgi:hypothetical protein